MQGGEDECREHDVCREQLETLRDRCREVQADHAKAGLLLPPQGGFFFGSTELDEGYFLDVSETEEKLSALLANPRLKDWDFAYRSSW